MPDYQVARANKDKAGTLIQTGSPDVFVNDFKAATEGSTTKGGDVITHSKTTVYVNGKRIAIDGAVTAGGSVVGHASENVYAGEMPPGISVVYNLTIPNPPSINAPTAAETAQSSTWNQTVPDTQQGSVPLPPTDAPRETPPVNLPIQSNGDIKQFLDQILAEAIHWTRGQQPLGPNGNINIVKLFTDIGADKWAQNESTAWCAAFVNFVLKNTGYVYTADLGVSSFYAKPSKWGGTVLYDRKTKGDGWKSAAPGDICVWDYGPKAGPTSHVNFVYANSGSLLQLCGGNQSGKAPNNNNPSGSSLTNGSKWNPSIDKPGNYSLMMIFRPQKRNQGGRANY
jgi:uncharacterized Zn-binding protein involved in type VI secretion